MKRSSTVPFTKSAATRPVSQARRRLSKALPLSPLSVKGVMALTGTTAAAMTTKLELHKGWIMSAADVAAPLPDAKTGTAVDSTKKA